VTALSVVVINRCPTPTKVRPATALVDELDPSADQVIWVDQAGLDPPFQWPSMMPVGAPSGASRGLSYRLGLSAACHQLVAFTDSSTAVQPGWRASALEALDSGAGVVGGPVLPSTPRSMASWAGFIVDYGPHAVAPYTSATGDVSGNNVAYRRELLPPGDRPLWKHDVSVGLRAAAVHPTLATGMRVVAHREYRWHDLALARVPSGALYATGRSATWSLPRRLMAALGSAGLPPLTVSRLWVRLSRQPELRSRLLASLPGVVLAAVSWSVGEASGYILRRGAGSHVW
jgi:hypothetical protein